MADPLRIACLVGSLRTDSYNRRLARAIERVAGDRLAVTHCELGELPLYNQDDDAAPPPPSAAFKQRIAAADAVLFITPEYNRSVPGVLKNAIDIASRPYGQSAFDGKPAGVITLSPGTIGGFGANHHLRQSLVFLNMPVLQQPEAYLGGAGDLFDERGAVKTPESKQFLEKFLAAFAAWVERNAKAAA